ncbi:MAG: LacI family DNA-binding transcriptional regulator [Jiangellaceae bacterium]
MVEFERAPRLVDVAESAGVSLATASRALAGRDGVSPSLAERVRDVAVSLGYVPNAHARALAGAAQPMVGLIVHDVADPYFAEIAKGVLRVADEQGLMVLINQSERQPEIELNRIRSLRAHRVGSIVLAGSGYVDAAQEADVAAEVLAFRDAGGRVALVGRHHLPVDAVLPDNQAGGRTAVRHLLDLGHRRIAVVAGPANLSTVADRLAGVLEEVEAAGTDPGDLVVEHDAFSRDGGVAATRRLLERGTDATAILALTDVMAMGALSVLRSAGRPVPGEISVMGFDDVTVAADLAPALTTVRLPMAEMGAMALGLTLRAPAARPRRRRTGHQLVIRDSTAPPRSDH